MARVFKEMNISAEGNILTLDSFELYHDIKNKKLDSEKMKRIVENAERYLDEEIPFLPLSLYREFFINGNRNNFETPYFRRREMMVTLAVAEHYERKGRFTDKLVDVVWAVLEESSWIIPAHTVHSPSRPYTTVPEVYNAERLHGIDLFSASTAAAMTAVYYYAKDVISEVSPLITERMEYEIRERAIKPFLHCTFSWTGAFGNKPNNWCPWIVCDTLYTAAIIEPDLYNRTRIVRLSMNYLDNFTAFYDDDGGCDEGPGYWSMAGGCYFDALEIIEDMSGGKIKVYSHPLVRAIGEYESKMNVNGNRFVCFADSHGKVVPGGAHLIRYGQKCGSEALVSFGAAMDRINTHGIGHSIPYRTIKSLYTPKVESAPKPAALKKTYMPGLKVMVCRESEDSSVGMFFAMKGGHNAESHNHNDVGSFVVYYNGEPVLIDVGVGQYTKQTFSADRYKLWFMQSNYHNLPTFDNIGEMQGRQYESKNEVYDEESCSLSVDISGAYPAECGVLSYTRCGRLDGGIVRVNESIVLDREREISFNFMSHVKPELTEPGRISLAEGRTLVYDTALTPEIEEFYSEGLNAKQAWDTENLWRIHLRITAKEYCGEFVVE